ncbi:glycosyltransferase family 2 protein [Aliiglaciecola sp. 3_MG-2023]|uniref:glycosyltransferase family 2 protein n=1 Tax=Aliiglaciecola sp. 3_MG-2023 TaxID=3062644 RepID=UPI0026E3A0B4|nr:glycosyltransferase family 2 protein [Aliiglaciecola sp. 3_MG-2023]MDO6691914.1 glycosyltransferase family 2 protein [Aliiglaciecola sp. 3_MG-2023]
MIGATVILYKPDMGITQDLLEAVLKQVDVVSIVDNSPVATELRFDKTNLHYHHFPNNIGIAAAHNVGLRDLRAAGCEYGMLLDQDSTIDEDFAFRLSSLLVASKVEKRPVVAIGPRIICSFSEKTVKPRVQREVLVYDEIVCVTQIISSGMMIDLSHLEAIGYKDESLFIDGVDHEWCWRAKQQNLMVAIADKVEMIHRLGDSRSKFAGITYKVGSPVRLYYQFRNILLLSRRGYVPKYWKTRNLCVLPIRFFANSLLQDRKLERLKFMLCGLWDGICKKDGAFSDNW